MHTQKCHAIKITYQIDVAADQPFTSDLVFKNCDLFCDHTVSLSVYLLLFGAPGRTRTDTPQGHEFLRLTRLPLRHRGIFMVQPAGIEPASPALQTGAMTTSAKVACCWRKTEESNPIQFLRTWFSRPVAGPSPLHHLPYLEHRVRFELTVFQICNLVRWAAPPPVLNIGLGSRNRTYAPWSQTKSDTISPYRELFLFNLHPNIGTTKRTCHCWDHQPMISGVIYNCYTS